MASSFAVFTALVSIAFAYILLDPLHTSFLYGKEFEPLVIDLPPGPTVVRDAENRLARGVRKYEGEIVGPESIIFDAQGRGPYVSVSDGRILRRNAADDGWETFATASPHWTAEKCAYKTETTADGAVRTIAAENRSLEHICGRPLGMAFHPETGDLFFCDAYFGLHRVGADGGPAELLVDTVEGQRMRFTNFVAVDGEEGEAGALYFTDTSTRHPRRDFLVAFMEGRADGRLMKLDLASRQVSVLRRGLRFANGVALSRDKAFLVVCETVPNSCSRYWLKGPKAGTYELFVSLPGVPDNVKLNPRGRFWVALHSRRSERCAWLAARPEWRKALMRTPLPGLFWYVLCMGAPHGLAVEVDAQGAITDLLEDAAGAVVQGASEVVEHAGKLWVGSILVPFVAVVDYVPPVAAAAK